MQPLSPLDGKVFKPVAAREVLGDPMHTTVGSALVPARQQAERLSMATMVLSETRARGAALQLGWVIRRGIQCPVRLLCLELV